MNAEHLPPPPPGVVTSSGEGVKRINNKPMLIIGGIALAFVGVLAVVAAQRAEQQTRPASQEQADASVVSTESAAAALAGFDVEAGLVAPAQSSVSPEQGESVLASIKVLSDEEAAQPPAPPQDPFEESLRQRRLTQLESALASSTGVMSAPLPAGSPAASPSAAPAASAVGIRRPRTVDDEREAALDAAQAFSQRMAAQLKGLGGADDGATPTATGDLQRFQGAADRWRLGNVIEDSTPYTLRAGAVIAGVMISGINSDLPGQVTAQVAQAVYDTETGRQLLIPQGTRLIGAYESKVIYAQRRIFVAWQRLVFPDGRVLDIDAMAGADPAGYSGFQDKVNNHYLRTFGSALLMSGIVAGVTLGDKPRSVDEVPSISEEARRQLAIQIGSVATKQLERNLNISPTLEIRPGYRFNIMVNKDLELDGKYAAR